MSITDFSGGGVGTNLVQFIIPAAGTASGSQDLRGQGLTRLHMDAGWDAANLNVQLSIDGATWQNVYDDAGNLYTITAAAGRVITFDPGKFPELRYLRFVSTAAQTAQRTLTAVARGFA